MLCVMEVILKENYRAMFAQRIELTRQYGSWKLVSGPSSARQDASSNEIHRVSAFKLRSFNFTSSLRGVLQTWLSRVRFCSLSANEFVLLAKGVLRSSKTD